jgi:DNA-binding IclR family transcriptional regulator
LEKLEALDVTADRKLTQVFYLPCPNFGQGTNKVITMEMLGRIRRMHLRDKVSLHEISKRTGLSRNTVRRWLREPQELKEPTYSRESGSRKLLSFVAELEQSFKADALRAAKRYRRTGRALYAQLNL